MNRLMKMIENLYGDIFIIKFIKDKIYNLTIGLSGYNFKLNVDKFMEIHFYLTMVMVGVVE